jgi:hypothetical protein
VLQYRLHSKHQHMLKGFFAPVLHECNVLLTGNPIPSLCVSPVQSTELYQSPVQRVHSLRS